jgi:hypothetical protein
VSLYLLLAAVLLAGFLLAWWLKREGERSWARHQEMVAAARRREQMQALTKAFADVRITLVDNFTPAMKRAGAALAQLAAAIRETERPS